MKARIFANIMKEQIQASPSSPLQIKMIVFFVLLSFFSNMQINSSRFFYMNPAFNCEGAQGKQTEEYACRNRQFCRIIEQRSVTAQLHLYCDSRTNDRILVQSSVGIGNWIGMIFTAIMSDRFGRSFCFFVAFFLMNASYIIQYIGIGYQIASLLVISEVACGFSAKIVYVNFLILSTRFLKKTMYQTVTICWLISSTCSLLLFSAVNPFIPTWKGLFCLYFIGIALMTVASYFVLIEDPIFYFEMGEYEQCMEVVRRIGRENGEGEEMIQGRIKEVEKCIEYCRENEEGMMRESYSMHELLRCDIIVPVIAIGLIGCCEGIASSSIDLSIQGLKLSYNQNLILTGLATIFGQLTAIYIIEHQQSKKRGFIIISLMCGVAGFLFFFPFCLENAVVESIAIVSLRIMLAWINNFYIRFKVDLFPQKYQGLLISVIEFISNFGKVLSPEITQISINHRLNPIFVANLIQLTVGTLPIFFIQQQRVSLQKSVHKPIEDDDRSIKQ